MVFVGENTRGVDEEIFGGDMMGGVQSYTSS